jgi:1-deoxy-D-xylulose-5-phosphate reductoisomerase
LEVISSFPHRFQVVALAAGGNVELLAAQAEKFSPRMVSFQHNNAVSPARARLLSKDYELLSPEEIAVLPEVDMLVVATSGKAGLAPTLAALHAGKNIALANKEVLVMAGELITSAARQCNVEILPLDSEHSAIWQCLRGEQREDISSLILTASGGPFYHYLSDELASVTPEAALRHPTWQMGKKVTIDSATLMNKGMEIIEAHWLFDMPYDNIEVVIHPESVVHSMVEFVDGSVKAQLSLPDMHLPIQYALSYPERLPNPLLSKIEWSQMRALTFEKPDMERFPCLKLAADAAKSGGTYPTVLCAADEVAVELFLSRVISFTDIAQLVKGVMEHHQVIEHPSLEEILVADVWARTYARSWSP